MRRAMLLTILVTAGMLLAGCGGGNFAGNPKPAPILGDLDFSVVVDPGSSVAAADIDGELTLVKDAVNGRTTSALPASYVGLQGMHFTPHTLPGTGFSGRLSVRISMGNPAAGEYDGVLLYLYYIDPGTLTATVLDTGRGDANNRVSFNINALGYFVIAENTAVARPGGFTVSAFADLAVAPVGTAINFWAVPLNGTSPYTFNWDFGDGNQAAGQQVSHAYASAGTYNVSLTATDAAGHLAPAVSTPIEIKGGQPGPLAIDQITVTPDPQDNLHFNYAVRLSGGTGPFTYVYTFDDTVPTDTEVAGAAAEHTFGTERLYFGDVEVSDSTGAIVTGGFVSDARRLLLEAALATGESPLDVMFTLTALGFDASDEITIDFGEGGVPQAAAAGQIPHTYTAAGLFEAQAFSVRTTGDEPYPFESNIEQITVTEGTYSPFIQLTQPLVPDPDEAFDIVGFGFEEATADRSVSVAGFELEVLAWSDNIITVQLPAGIRPDTGTLFVEQGGSRVSNPIRATFNAASIPARIQGVIPPVATAGTRVLITGHGFAPVTAVTIDGQTATLEYNTGKGILALLPGGLTEGAYDLEVGTGAAMLTFPIAIITSTDGDTPQLDSVTPQVQAIGEGDVELGGQRFGTMGTAIAFSEGYALPRSTHNSTLITLTDPGPSIDSWVCVINQKLVSNALDLTYMYRPQITTVDPDEAAVGETVDIVGVEFGTQDAGDQVLLGQTALPVQTWSDTLIQVQIPDGAANGLVVVEKKLVSNAVPFTVIPDTPGTPGGEQL